MNLVSKRPSFGATRGMHHSLAHTKGGVLESNFCSPRFVPSDTRFWRRRTASKGADQGSKTGRTGFHLHQNIRGVSVQGWRCEWVQKWCFSGLFPICWIGGLCIPSLAPILSISDQCEQCYWSWSSSALWAVVSYGPYLRLCTVRYRRRNVIRIRCCKKNNSR